MSSETRHEAPEALKQTRSAIEANLSAQPLADGVAMEELDAAGVGAVLLTPAGGSDTTIVYFHGGGFRLGSARGWAAYNSHLAARCGARVLTVDYRLAPEHPFPAALTDARTAYQWLLDSGVAANRIAVGGDSAGGGLTASLLVDLKQRGIATPACAFLLSPWADMRLITGSYDRCAETDQLFSRQSAIDGSAFYLDGHPADDPLVSPVLASWSGQPPLLIQVSELEVLSDDAANLAKAATGDGVSVQHEVFSNVQHVWQMDYPQRPEAVTAFDQIAAFVAQHTGASGPQ